jgi:hypothetical protein
MAEALMKYETIDDARSRTSWPAAAAPPTGLGRARGPAGNASGSGRPSSPQPDGGLGSPAGQGSAG